MMREGRPWLPLLIGKGYALPHGRKEQRLESSGQALKARRCDHAALLPCCVVEPLLCWPLAAGDLKPANCCLVESSEPSSVVQIRVVDFGNTVACSECAVATGGQGLL